MEKLGSQPPYPPLTTAQAAVVKAFLPPLPKLVKRIVQMLKLKEKAKMERRSSQDSPSEQR